MSTDADKILQTIFGYTSFRSPQKEIIESISGGDDALVLMPTGGGKSLCYQIPALLRDGCGIVISPLIALMQDQVSALRLLGVNASFLNSTLERDEETFIEHQLKIGALDLLYIAPERLLQNRTIALLKSTTIALFAIDEAHCVSQWGHDFRSSYRDIPFIRKLKSTIPIAAFTATATTKVKDDIILNLELKNPNLHFNNL